MLARHCHDKDARFLVSLFPGDAPRSKKEAIDVFRSHDDPRSMCWTAVMVGEINADSELLVRRSAEAGYEWAMCSSGVRRWGEKARAWVEQAAAKDEPDALAAVSVWYLVGEGVEVDVIRSDALCRRAALLGCSWGQLFCAQDCCVADSTEQFEWYRRSAIQGNGTALRHLVKTAREQVQLYEQSGSGRLLFEIRAAIAGNQDWSKADSIEDVILAGERALAIYNQWIADARRSILCWLWCAKQREVSKDIRLLIADLFGMKELCGASEFNETNHRRNEGPLFVSWLRVCVLSFAHFSQTLRGSFIGANPTQFRQAPEIAAGSQQLVPEQE